MKTYTNYIVNLLKEIKMLKRIKDWAEKRRNEVPESAIRTYQIICDEETRQRVENMSIFEELEMSDEEWDKIVRINR